MASASAAALVCTLLVGAGRDPAATVGATAILRERAEAALLALDALDRALDPALDAARDGAGLVVGGDGAPGERLAASAVLVDGAIDDAGAAEEAVRQLEAVRRATDVAARPLPAPPAATEVAAIGEGLRMAARGADAAAGLRTRATNLVARLEESLASVASGDVARARAAAADAHAEHASISAAEAGSVTLPLWLDATDAMITAVTRLIDATEAGDDDAMAAARAEIASLSEDAATADRALDIAVADAASAATGSALTRLATAVAAVSATRAAIEAALAEPAR